MKHRIIYFTVLWSSFYLHAGQCFDVLELRGNSFLSPRSQSVNTARFLAGWQPYINRNVCGFYGAFAVTPEFTRTFRPSRLAEYFFGTDTLTISGSQVEQRGELDLLADYFGLSPTFESTVFIEPSMHNVLADLSWFGGWHCWYMHVHAPIVRARTAVRLCENIINDGTDTFYPANYMSEQPLPAPFTSFSNALQGNRSFGDVQGRLFGNLCCPQHITRLSDIQLAIGYNAVKNYCGHFGFDLRLSIPTGNRSTAQCLFPPMVGNGHHWGLGAGFSGHGLIWEKDGEQTWYVVVDAHIEHLLKSRQQRSFDLHNRFGSRYSIAKIFNEAQTYTRVSTPAINATTLPVDIRVAIQAEGAVMFAYRYNCFGFDIGYNAWLRAREHILCPPLFPQDRYALKGIQNVTIGDLPSPATQSRATIHGDKFADQALVADLNPPVFFNRQDINFSSGTNPLAFTHKIFWHLQYNSELTSNPCTKIYLGTGGEVEFEGFRPKCTFQPNQVAMSQWGLWIKGGMGY